MPNPLRGGIGFSAETQGPGTALTVPYEKAANNATSISSGHAVVRVGNSRLVQRAAVTSGVISSTTIEGFAAQDDSSTDNNTLGSQFGIMPPVYRPGGNEEILVHPAVAATRFRLALIAGKVAGKAQIGKTCDIAVDANGAHRLSPDTTANALATIVDFPQKQEGVDGGQMYFIIAAAKSSYPH